MCGRYSLHANPEVIALAFKLGLMPEIKAHYNIAPSTPILIVCDAKEKGRVLGHGSWITSHGIRALTLHSSPRTGMRPAL